MNTTAVEHTTGLEKSESDRLREDLDQLRHDVARLSTNMGAATSRRVRPNTAAARTRNTAAARNRLEGARHRTAAMGRNVADEIKTRPVTVVAVASALGLLALAVYMWR